MKMFSTLGAFSIAIALSVLSADAAAQAPEVTPTGNIDSGKVLYHNYGCYACHGHTGETGVGAQLNPSRFLQAAFIAYVRNPPRISSGPFRMPAYGGETVTDQVLADIYAYLESLDSGTVPVDEIPLLEDL
jgi:mono/diheme cytochrome c family protein